MPEFQKLIFALASLLVGASAGAATEATSLRPIRFGIAEFAEYSVNLPIIPATVKVLENTFGKEKVQARILPVEELRQEAIAGNLDVILSSAGLYRRLSIEGAGIHNLASVASERFPDPNHADGSVFITSSKRTDIREVEDLRGKRVAVTQPFAFAGWQVAQGELARRGISPESFFAEVAFQGHGLMIKVVEAVLEGKTDAGIVKACFLEDMGVDMSRLRILGARPQDASTVCVHSTDLFPNWTMSVFPTMPAEASRKLATALFSMPPTANDLHWSVATDFRGIDALFWKLKIGPYAYLQNFSFARFMAQYWPGFVIALVILTLVLWHNVTLGSAVRRRTAQLAAALAEEKRLEAETQEAQKRFHALQKAGIIGQMSSIIAHELRQPLGCIELYCHGLLRGFEDMSDTRESTVRAIEQIRTQTQRAADIVDQVRSYAKGNRRRGLMSFTKAVASGLSQAQKNERRTGAQLRMRDTCGVELFVNAHPLEVELIVVNLVKNALEACSTIEGGMTEVELSCEGGYAVFTVTNDGERITDSTWKVMETEGLESGKTLGLGLGLSIVRSITSDLGGLMHLERRAKGGLVAQVRLKTEAHFKENTE